MSLKVSATEIEMMKAYREEKGCSLLEAKRVIMKRKIISSISRSRTYGGIRELCDAVELLVEELL